MERLEREGVKSHSLFKPNLKIMKVHSVTCTCIIELNEKRYMYTLADFPSTWTLRCFLSKSSISPKGYQ